MYLRIDENNELFTQFNELRKQKGFATFVSAIRAAMWLCVHFQGFSIPRTPEGRKTGKDKNEGTY